MRRHIRSAIVVAAALSCSTTMALAAVPTGVVSAGLRLPFGGSGMLGLVAAVVVGGIYLARRKRPRD